METLPEIRINFGGSFAQETPGPHLQKEKKIHQTCTQDRPSNMPKSEVHSSNKPVEKPKPEVHHSIGFVEKSKPEVHLSDELVKELKIELATKDRKIEHLKNKIKQLKINLMKLQQLDDAETILRNKMELCNERYSVRTRQMQDEIIALNERLHNLKKEGEKQQVQQQEDARKIQHLSGELKRERDRMQKVATQLAVYRRKKYGSTFGQNLNFGREVEVMKDTARPFLSKDNTKQTRQTEQTHKHGHAKEVEESKCSTCSSGGSVHFTNLQQNGNANKGFLTCECECESMKMERPGRELGFKEAAIKNLDIQLDGRDNEIQENTGHFERALSDRGCTHIGCGPSGRALQGASNVCSGRSIKRLGDELARLKAENRYLKRELQQFNPTVSQEVEDLKLECKELSKVCTYYAGLLHSYSERLGLPFKPLSHVHVDITSETYDALIDPI